MFRNIIGAWCLIHILNAEGPSSHDVGSPGTPNNQVDVLPIPNVENPMSTYPLGKKREGKPVKQCLTGYMTDVQSWVDEHGKLNPRLNFQYLIDVSSKQDPIVTLQEEMHHGKAPTSEVKYLSMSNCKLRRVPSVFSLADRRGRTLYSTIEYLTFYGNEFAAVSAAGVAFDENMNASNALNFADVAIRWPGPTVWATGLNKVTFHRLRELDLRKCNIQHLTDDLFINMPALEALYLGENQIAFVTTNAFRGLNKLQHLDLSKNSVGMEDKGIIFEHINVLSHIKNLKSLDMSLTVMSQYDINVLWDLRNLTKLSICYAGIAQLPKDFFKESSIKYLDVSGNIGILSRLKSLEGLQNNLKVLYAKEIGLKSFDVFRNLKKLEVLDIEGNEINSISSMITTSLKNLQILNLNYNRITVWFDMVFSYMKKLRLLSLKENNINMISTEMIQDMQNISYVALSKNFIVCNCQTRELFEIAYRNENKPKPKLINPKVKENAPYSFHRGFDDFNILVAKRNQLVRKCEEKQPCEVDEDIESEGKFLILDFEEDLYRCLLVVESKSIPFSQVNTCADMKREADYIEVISDSRKQLMVLIIIPVLLFPILIFCYVFRRNLKYFFITIKNSATLSMIHNDEVIDDGTIFHYDVFVSYCNDDRNWVLDELLPHVEKGSNISICLHERDFQVGLSILENIVSCMDRSRSIMLIISQQFLMSQWCQFEMHLAQHRLLETRREDLILVLLEDIPRRLRPTTLHYLMLTKTYIVWPKKEGDQPAFWKRLSRSILARRQVSQDNISLA